MPLGNSLLSTIAKIKTDINNYKPISSSLFLSTLEGFTRHKNTLLSPKWSPAFFFEQHTNLSRLVKNPFILFRAIWQHAVYHSHLPLIDYHKQRGWVYHTLLDLSGFVSDQRRNPIRGWKKKAADEFRTTGNFWSYVMDQENVLPESCTYFIYSEQANLVKIGSTGDLPGRLRGLQYTSPSPLKILAFDRDIHLEKQYHKKFADNRCWGEWFKPCLLMANLIDDIRMGRFWGEEGLTTYHWKDPMVPDVLESIYRINYTRKETE